MGEVFGEKGVRRAAASTVLGLAVPLGFLGCLGAAELEDPLRFDALKEPAQPTNCDQALPSVPSGCDYATPLRTSCARGGCHNSTAAAGLDLTAGPLLIARILDVPATHGANNCGVEQCLPAAPACDACQACPSGDLLLSRADFASSWIVRKMADFIPGSARAPDMGCGVAMPPPQLGAPAGYTQDHKDCLLEFFRAIADNGRPCTVSLDGGTDGGT